MKIKAVIIDDELSARETLNIMLQMYVEEVEVVAEADSVKSGVNTIKQENPDLVFLDINMRDGSGFDLLNSFPSCNFKTIFVTAYEEYAVKAFKFSALDYLVKPVTPDDLVKATNKISASFKHENLKSQLEVFESNYFASAPSFRKIILKTAESIYIVEINDIIHCKSEDNYTYFYLSGSNKLLVSRTLKEFDELLGKDGFFRVHQSHLINITQIDRFDKREGGSVVMKDGSIIPVSFRRKDQLMQVIQNLGKHL